MEPRSFTEKVQNLSFPRSRCPRSGTSPGGRGGNQTHGNRSHSRATDLAATRPFDDFDVNAVGTLNLLEAARRACPEAPFVHMSTNKVYGDAPNRLTLVEKATRWDYADAEYANGIKESFGIDHSMHSIFGASKV